LPVTTLTTTPACPHCDGTMGLVHQIDLEDMPEIYIFYCACCQLAETVKQEALLRKHLRSSRPGRLIEERSDLLALGHDA
jgi:hypothetical protein